MRAKCLCVGGGAVSSGDTVDLVLVDALSMGGLLTSANLVSDANDGLLG